MARELVNKRDNVFILDLVGPEDTLANTDMVLTGRGPVELLHTSITDERSVEGVEGGEIVTGDDDGDTQS